MSSKSERPGNRSLRFQGVFEGSSVFVFETPQNRQREYKTIGYISRLLCTTGQLDFKLGMAVLNNNWMRIDHFTVST